MPQIDFELSGAAVVTFIATPRSQCLQESRAPPRAGTHDLGFTFRTTLVAITFIVLYDLCRLDVDLGILSALRRVAPDSPLFSVAGP